MACISPLLAYRDKDGAMRFLSRDKWSIYEAERYFGRENVFFIPCGHCSSCRLAKRKEYAIRCAMEAKSYDFSSFITLTYDDDNNPGYLRKRDLQAFIKKIRNKGYKVRYFGCGEYGAMTNRPHYHIALFGYFPKDAKKFSDSASKVPMFTSLEVDSCWNKGFATIQYFSAECAGYIAGYVQKKIGDEKSFMLMSKKPGLGAKYMEENKDILLQYDHICDDFGNIKKAKAPRYFDKLCDRLGIDMTYTKEKRIEAMQVAQAGEMYQLGLEREAILLRKKEVSDRKERKLVRGL